MKETDAVSEILCSVVSRISDDGQNPKKSVIFNVIHHFF
jgi:hypothetical protein